MPDDFDPYYKWLAIPPAEQPPNHYRLLGVPLFTADPDVLENAADQRMAHLRSFQSGRYSQASQQILNEVATARVCLLNTAQRNEYDAQLRRQLQPQPVQPRPMPLVLQPIPIQAASLQPIPLPPPVAPPVAEAVLSPATVESPLTSSPLTNARMPKRKPRGSPVVEIAKHIAGSAAGLLLGYLLVGFFSPAWDHFHLFHAPRAANVQSPALVLPKETPVRAKETPQEVEPPPAKPIARVNSKTERPVLPPPIVQPQPRQPPPEAPPQPTAEELARQAEEAKQKRAQQMQADRDAAVAAGKVRDALRLTAELAQLRELDRDAEQVRIIEELRKLELPAPEYAALASALLERARLELENDRRDQAAEQATAALQLARKSADQELVRQATKLILEVQNQE